MEDQANKTLNNILAKVVNIDSELKDVKETMVTKREFAEFRDKIYTHIDGFTKLHA